MSDSQIRAAIELAAQRVRSEKPLVPSITNTVTQDFVANAQLAVGASAAMVWLPEECETLAARNAFYINIGTAFPFYADTIPRTAQALDANHTPWVLDPVGIGFSDFRNDLLLKLRSAKPAVIRANPAEIIALANLWGLVTEQASVRGVDSDLKVPAAKVAALKLARFTGGVVAVSGEEDLVTDGNRIILCAGGSDLLTKITGAGCALGGVTAVFCAVAEPFIAALAAATLFNIAGNIAAARADAPASFKIHFLDSLFRVSPKELADNFRVVGSLEKIFELSL